MKKKQIGIGILTAALLLGGGMFSGCTKKADKETLRQAEEKVKAEQYEEALELFAGLEKKDVELRQVYRGMGLAYMGLGDYEKACSFLEKSLKEAGGKVSEWEYDTNYYLAVAFEKSGRRQEAIDTWGNLLAVKEESNSYFERGLLYLKDGNVEKAEADFDMSIAADEKNPKLPVQIYEAVGEDYPELGKKYLQALTGREAKNGEELYYKGIAYRGLGEENAAEDVLKQAVDKGFSEANLILGEMFLVPESYDYGMSFYQAYVKENPEKGEAYVELMGAYMKREDYSGALQVLEQAKETAGEESRKQLLWYEIVCYEYKGDYAAAREKAGDYLEAYPQEEKVQKEYDFLLTR